MVGRNPLPEPSIRRRRVSRAQFTAVHLVFSGAFNSGAFNSGALLHTVHCANQECLVSLV